MRLSKEYEVNIGYIGNIGNTTEYVNYIPSKKESLLKELAEIREKIRIAKENQELGKIRKEIELAKAELKKLEQPCSYDEICKKAGICRC